MINQAPSSPLSGFLSQIIMDKCGVSFSHEITVTVVDDKALSHRSPPPSVRSSSSKKSSSRCTYRIAAESRWESCPLVNDRKMKRREILLTKACQVLPPKMPVRTVSDDCIVIMNGPTPKPKIVRASSA
ncbi:expressed unknown protein [Seminavis robusta]|uniref:Uncharacterized protein n=1 Tax=Seminavis robusta TaxID=568900 RepID=A0A9N8H8D0_9STRA|nr:expressed unknown protein [Seminavis robusta]|eukprot:Sro165_g073900.1 n/a (129) ;mRNA; r:55219-55605